MINTPPTKKTRRLKGQNIVGKLNRDNVLEFAVRTIINFGELTATAKNLIEKESQFGLGRTIAIVAIEELGKFVVALRYLANQMKEEEFADRIYRHPPKQTWGQLILILTPLIERLSSAQAIGDKSTITADHFIQNLDTSPEMIGEKEISELTPQIQKIAELFESGKLEMQRQAGLYVSIRTKGTQSFIEYPNSIDEKEAREILQLLETFNLFVAQSKFDVSQLFDMSVIEDSTATVLDDKAITELKGAIDRMCTQLGQYM